MLVEKSAETVFTPLENGNGVLLNLETLFYYSLNNTGVALWQKIEQAGKPTLDVLAETICKRFEVDDDSARREIITFITRLAELKLVRVS